MSVTSFCVIHLNGDEEDNYHITKVSPLDSSSGLRLEVPKDHTISSSACNKLELDNDKMGEGVDWIEEPFWLELVEVMVGSEW